MWALKVLNGPQAGQLYVLNNGKIRIGRGEGCDLKLLSPGISKEHIEIQVTGNTIIVKDLKSSNGTFLNGVRIQGAAINFGDKISLSQIILDVVKAPEAASTGAMVPFQPHVQNQDPAAPTQASVPSPMVHSPIQAYQQRAEEYLNHVVLPGIYRMVEVFQFRSVIFGFAVVFIFMVTVLSLFPMNQITSESIQIESERRALTVARALASSNEKAIRSGELSAYSADLVLRENGINNVYILSKDGSIMAPPEMVGMSAKDIAGFVSRIKGQTKEMSAHVGDGKIAASVPILVFDPEIQQNVAKAHAVVVYDTGSMKFDDGRALALFVQMLTLALILGAGIFFLMFKLIEYPFQKLHQEVDSALREGRDHAQIDIKFPILQQLLISINSLLTRSQQSGASVATAAQTRDDEWVNMLELFGYPALLLSKDRQILSLNSAFESLTGTQRHLVQGQAIAYLPDQALQKNISELVETAHSNTQTLHSDRLEISGHMFLIQCQAITVAGEARYYLIGISPLEAAEGGAA